MRSSIRCRWPVQSIKAFYKAIWQYKNVHCVGNGELVFRGDRVSVGEDEKVLETDSGEDCMAA